MMFTVIQKRTTRNLFRPSVGEQNKAIPFNSTIDVLNFC